MHPHTVRAGSLSPTRPSHCPSGLAIANTARSPPSPHPSQHSNHHTILTSPGTPAMASRSNHHQPGVHVRVIRGVHRGKHGTILRANPARHTITFQNGEAGYVQRSFCQFPDLPSPSNDTSPFRSLSAPTHSLQPRSPLDSTPGSPARRPLPLHTPRRHLRQDPRSSPGYSLTSSPNHSPSCNSTTLRSTTGRPSYAPVSSSFARARPKHGFPPASSYIPHLPGRGLNLGLTAPNRVLAPAIFLPHRLRLLFLPRHPLSPPFFIASRPSMAVVPRFESRVGKHYFLDSPNPRPTTRLQN
jgi:hypothetical protein